MESLDVTSASMFIVVVGLVTSTIGDLPDTVMADGSFFVRSATHLYRIAVR